MKNEGDKFAPKEKNANEFNKAKWKLKSDMVHRFGGVSSQKGDIRL